MTIVAVHGNGGGGFRFARLAPHWPAWVDFRAITLPGFAETPRDPSIRRLADLAAALRPWLAAAPRPRVLLGHGIGGSIALEFCQRFAEEIDGLILHAPVGARLNRRLFPRLMALPGARPIGQRLFAARAPRPIWRRLLFSQPVPKRYLDRFFEEYGRCAVFGQLFELITPAWFEGLAPIGTPAALLWGGRERVLGVEQAADYRRLLPNSRPLVVPTWDHFPMIETPAAYASVVARLARELVAG